MAALHPRIQNFFWHRDRPDTTVEWVRGEAAQGMEFARPLVVVGGMFEALHCGDMRTLFAAREKAGQGGSVVAMVASDRWARSELGEGRPLQSFIERATALSYMPVDLVVEVDSHKEAKELVKALRPELAVFNPSVDSLVRSVEQLARLRKMFVRAGGMNCEELIRRAREVGK